jgi:hypothetical protein
LTPSSKITPPPSGLPSKRERAIETNAVLPRASSPLPQFLTVVSVTKTCEAAARRSMLKSHPSMTQFSI